jgi:uncharacterized protein (TIGR04222 family)
MIEMLLEIPGIEMLLKIPGKKFLVIFILFSAFCIFAAWLLNKLRDDSTRYPMPNQTSLNPFEMAALRDGRKGVIETALFNLYNRDLLTITGTGYNTADVQKNDSTTQKPEGAIEEIVYEFTNQTRKPKDFFTNTALQNSLDKFIEPINQKLEEMQLKFTHSQTKRTWIILIVTLLLIIGIGGIKASFGIFLYHKPAGFLIALIFILSIIAFVVLQPSDRTALGKTFQKQLAKTFEWIKDEEVTETELDPAFKVAIFGMAALSGFVAYSLFEDAFSKITHSKSSSSGSSWWSGSGGYSGGCGYSCGGCGIACGGCGSACGGCGCGGCGGCG